MADATLATHPTIDWSNWLRSWDRQQEAYLPDREERFTAMLDVLDLQLRPDFVALDLACGPGAISQRLLERFPNAQAIALDTDPVLLALGEGALGDMGGRLTWAKDDLTDLDWIGRLPQTLAGRPLDAVLSSTALHWLSGADLARVYRQLGALMPEGSVLMNADNMSFGPQRPTIQRIASAVKQREQAGAVAVSDKGPWEAWWDAVGQEPTLATLLAERTERLRWFDRAWINPSYDFQVGALHEAGFREVATFWQRRDNRILLAVR
ncbi:MAG: class I SAM-dependent methyltransferase [Chloroflexota bacterium]